MCPNFPCTGKSPGQSTTIIDDNQKTASLKIALLIFIDDINRPAVYLDLVASADLFALTRLYFTIDADHAFGDSLFILESSFIISLLIEVDMNIIRERVAATGFQ